MMRLHNKGFTLVELMVSMLISLMLMAAIIEVFSSNIASFRTANENSVLNDNARYSMSMLGHQIREAGHQFQPLNDINGDGLGYQAASASHSKLDVAFDDGTYLFGTESESSFDTLYLRYQGAVGRALKTCNKQHLDSKSSYIEFFYIKPMTDRFGNPTGQLVCNVFPNTSLQDVVFTDYVDMFRVLYGVDTNDDDTADKYVSADNVTNAALSPAGPSRSSDWVKVVSVRVALLLRTAEPVLPQATSVAYQLLDKEVTYNDQFSRKVVSSNITLRNVIP